MRRAEARIRRGLHPLPLAKRNKPNPNVGQSILTIPSQKNQNCNGTALPTFIESLVLNVRMEFYGMFLNEINCF